MKLACVFAVFVVSASAADAPKKLPTSAADLAAGRKLFENQCALCHGQSGEGGRGPLLVKPRLAKAPDDAALIKVIQDGIEGTEMPGAWAMSEDESLQTAAYVRSLGKVDTKPVPGNPTAGAALYRSKGGCANCHALKGEGGISGPDLAGIGDRRSAVYLRESLLNPEAALPDGYMLTAVTLKNGTKITGTRANEDSFSIQIRDAAGRTHSFWKTDIAQLNNQFGKSPMPSYKTRLTEAELTDMVAYLVSLKESK